MERIKIIVEKFNYLLNYGFSVSPQKSNFGDGVAYSMGENCIFISFDIRSDRVNVDCNRDNMDPFKWQNILEIPIGDIQSRDIVIERVNSVYELAKNQKLIYRGLPEKDFAEIISIYASYLKEHGSEILKYFHLCTPR